MSTKPIQVDCFNCGEEFITCLADNHTKCWECRKIKCSYIGCTVRYLPAKGLSDAKHCVLHVHEPPTQDCRRCKFPLQDKDDEEVYCKYCAQTIHEAEYDVAMMKMEISRRKGNLKALKNIGKKPSKPRDVFCFHHGHSHQLTGAKKFILHSTWNANGTKYDCTEPRVLPLKMFKYT